MRNLLATGDPIFDFGQGLYVAPGNGSGTFTPSRSTTHLFGLTQASSLATLDLNRDSYDDLSYVFISTQSQSRRQSARERS